MSDADDTCMHILQPSFSTCVGTYSTALARYHKLFITRKKKILDYLLVTWAIGRYYNIQIILKYFSS